MTMTHIHVKPKVVDQGRLFITTISMLENVLTATSMIMAPVPDGNRVEDPLREVQALQKDLKSFARAVNKPLRDNISYPAFAVDPAQLPRRGLLASQNPGDVAILDRLKFVRNLPGKAATAALVRQALTLQDGNVRVPCASTTPPPAQGHHKSSAQPTPRQDQAASSEAQAPVTAADFQDQLYDASGTIDLTRVRLKIGQHQQDLIAAGLQEPPEQQGLDTNDAAPQAAPLSKLRWQSAAGNSKPIAKDTDYNLSQHEKQSRSRQEWVPERKLWEQDATDAPVVPQQASKQAPQQAAHPLLHHALQHITEPPSDPGGTHRLEFASALPLESRQDDSLAAYHSLLTEEAQRMLLHASADGTQYSAKSLLRTPHHLVPLVEACKTLQGLRTLDLSLNALSDAALPQLQRLVEAGAQLTSLDLSNNNFSSQGAASLCSIISHVSSHRPQSHGPRQHPVSTLPLQAPQSSEPAAGSTAGVESPASASHILDLASEDSVSQDRLLDASAACEGLDSHLDSSSAASAPSREGVSHAQFDSSLSRSGGEASTSDPDLPAGPCLRRLVLSQNPLGDKGLLGLVAGCPKGQGVALTELRLEGCRLGCFCAKPLIAILQDWASLQQLTLSWNNLGIRGAQAIAHAVKSNDTLVSLDLSQCGLTDMGGAQLALSLADNRALQHLDLSCNQLQAATCAALGHVVSAGCHLQHLRLDRNPLSKQGAVVLVQAAASKQCRLQQLQLHGCGIADSACIQKAIQLRAAEALENAKPKKKAKKKKKKAAKGKEDAAGAKKKKKEAPAAAPAAKPGIEHHVLDLALPLDWAKLMGLVQTARSGAIAWKNLVVAGKKRTGPLPPDTWPAEMPMSGKMEFDVKPAAIKPDEPAKASTTAAAPEAASTPDDSFCQLVGANMSTDTQCLDDWRLQMLELLPAAGIQLTQVQALKLSRAFPGLLEGLLRSEDQHRALTALGQCCKQLPIQLLPASTAHQDDLKLAQMRLT